MNNEQELAAALRALAESDGERQAPPEVELRLREAFRARCARRRWKQAAVWTAAAAAIVVAVVAIPHQGKQPTPVQATTAQPVQVPVAVTVASPPARKHPVRHVRSRPQEIVTDFFPLIEPTPPLGRGELLRVSLPASAMRTVGLPVREDRLSERVEADVLVSEDGLAEAIRFVNVPDHR